MRTLIYVHEPSTVTIHAKAASDAAALLCRYNQGAGQVAIGKHRLERGIYLIVSNSALEVSGSHAEVAVLHNDKDIPPDPGLTLLALEPGATASSYRAFLEIAKDISVGDPRA
jgi:hypothetical protein